MTTVADILAEKELERKLDRACTDLRFMVLDIQVQNAQTLYELGKLSSFAKKMAFNPDYDTLEEII